MKVWTTLDPLTFIIWTFFKTASFVLYRRKKVIHFGVKYPFNLHIDSENLRESKIRMTTVVMLD